MPDVVEIRNFENRSPSASERRPTPVVSLWLVNSLPLSLPPSPVPLKGSRAHSYRAADRRLSREGYNT